MRKWEKFGKDLDVIDAQVRSSTSSYAPRFLPSLSPSTIPFASRQQGTMPYDIADRLNAQQKVPSSFFLAPPPLDSSSRSVATSDLSKLTCPSLPLPSTPIDLFPLEL